MRLRRFLAVVLAQSVTVLFGGGTVWAADNQVRLDMKLKTSSGITHSKVKTEFGKSTSIKSEKGVAKYLLEIIPQRGPLQGNDDPQMIKLDVKIQELLKNGKTRNVAASSVITREDEPATVTHNSGAPDGFELTIEPSL